MFFRQVTKENKDILETVEVVPCFECGVLLRKEYACVVKTNLGDELYCVVHKPEYTLMSYAGLTGLGYRYYKSVEVTKEGELIGYKKVAKKNITKAKKVNKK